MPRCTLEYGDLFYDEIGQGNPIIFLHPPGMGRKVFRFQKPLCERYKLIFPDLSGHGDSSAFQKNVTIQGYTEEVLKLADSLGLEKITLCGYSSGGSIAQEFAIVHPDRTESVILCGGFAEVQSPALKYEHILGMYFVENSPKTLAKVIATAHTFDKNFRNELIEHMLKTDLHTWFHFYHESLNYSCIRRLKNLSVPLLLVYGERDFINQHLRAYERELEDVRTAIIPKVSHQVPVKKWQEFNSEAFKFLEDITERR